MQNVIFCRLLTQTYKVTTYDNTTQDDKIEQTDKMIYEAKMSNEDEDCSMPHHISRHDIKTFNIYPHFTRVVFFLYLMFILFVFVGVVNSMKNSLIRINFIKVPGPSQGQ